MLAAPPHLPQGFSLSHTLSGHNDIIGRLAWSPDGLQLATPSYDGTVRLWDTANGVNTQILEGHENFVTGAAWSPGGRLLASSSDDRTVIVWDLASGGKPARRLKHSDVVTGVAWSKDERVLASSSDDKLVRLWNAKTGRLIKPLEGHTNRVLGVAWSPDGKTLASASWDGTVRLWDGKTGAQRRSIGHGGKKVNHVAWSPDGQLVATACHNSVRIWDADTGSSRAILTGASTFYGLSFSSDGRFLASKSLDGTIKFWECCDWHTAADFSLSPSEWPYTCVVFHPNKATLAAAGEHDRVVYLLDVDFGRPALDADFDRPARSKVFICYSHKDKRWFKELNTFLRPLVRSQAIDVWSDELIEPGDEWMKEIERAIASAKVAVLLVSANFIDSTFIQEYELPRLLAAAQRGGMKLLWIAVGFCQYEKAGVEERQAVNDPSKPLESLRPAALHKKLTEICRLIEAAAAKV